MADLSGFRKGLSLAHPLPAKSGGSEGFNAPQQKMDHIRRLVRLVWNFRASVFHRSANDSRTGTFRESASLTAHGGRLSGGAVGNDDIYGAVLSDPISI